MAEDRGSGADLKDHSCLTCRQRKIKCDRRSPCSNCVKAAQQCTFVAPTRGKRKRTKPPREGLHAKVRRYEELLRSYGVKIEPTDFDDGDSDSEVVSQPRLLTPVEARTSNEAPCYPLQQKPRFIHKEGSSRYIDRCVYCFYHGLKFTNSLQPSLAESRVTGIFQHSQVRQGFS